MSDTHFSLRNELPAVNGRGRYLELNPAVMAAERDTCFALSVVYVGPEMNVDGQPLPLRVTVDESSVLMRAVAQKSKPVEAGESLTVALYSVSRSFLERLASGDQVEVCLGNDEDPLVRPLASANRDNVARFLDFASQSAASDHAAA